MATTLYDPAGGWKAHFLGARTDAAGTAVDDAFGEDLRTLVDAFFTEGVAGGANAFQVLEDSPTGMTVVIGSGTAKADHAVIDGDIAGQGAYLVRMEDATVDLTVPAADLSNPRIDEVYLVVQDNAYDSSSRVLPRIAYRDGTPASSPSAPGPDAAWDAYLLVATVAVGAGVTEITDSDITDERVFSTSNVDVAAGRVATAAIQDDAVTNPKIGPGAVDTTELANDAVTQPKIGPGAVDTTELADDAVVTSKLGVVSTIDLGSGSSIAVSGSTLIIDTAARIVLQENGVTVWRSDGTASFEVDGSTEVSSQALTSSFADVATVSLSIPTSWGSWKCEAWASYAASGSEDAYQTQIRIDGTDQQVKEAAIPNDGGSPVGVRLDGAVGGRRTGMTTTGSRSVSLRARETAGNVGLSDIYLYARAVRTS